MRIHQQPNLSPAGPDPQDSWWNGPQEQDHHWIQPVYNHQKAVQNHEREDGFIRKFMVHFVDGMHRARRKLYRRPE